MNRINQTFTNGQDTEHFKIVVVGGGLVRFFLGFSIVDPFFSIFPSTLDCIM